MRDDLLSKAILRAPRSIRFKGRRAFTTSWAGAEMYVGEPGRAAAHRLDLGGYGFASRWRSHR